MIFFEWAFWIFFGLVLLFIAFLSVMEIAYRIWFKKLTPREQREAKRSKWENHGESLGD